MDSVIFIQYANQVIWFVNYKYTFFCRANKLYPLSMRDHLL